jgi:excisionase family DNA binding protein
MEKLLYTLAEVKKMLGISAPTMMKMMREKTILVKQIGGKRFVSAEDLKAFIEALPAFTIRKGMAELAKLATAAKAKKAQERKEKAAAILTMLDTDHEDSVPYRKF